MRYSPLASLVVVCASLASAVAAPPAQQKTEFLRFVRDEKTDSGKLEVAIAHYENDKGQKVDLVGAVHVGDVSYYKALNDRFKKYDAVLYEMIKPKDAAMPEPGAAPRSGIGMMQIMITQVLDLTYQLDQVDYNAPNFVHADLDTDEFYRRMDERGESLLTLMLRAMMNGMNRPVTATNNPDVQLGQFLFALQAPDRARQLKLFVGAQFQDIDAQVAMLEGPEGSTILTDRNAAALKVLDEQLQTGKKSLAIFYGAAHLRGMETKMVDEMGFKLKGEDWLTAWDIPPAKNAANLPAAGAAK